MEYLKGKASIKCGKSCGKDGVMPELLKYVPIDNIILRIINEVYNGGEQPHLWRRLGTNRMDFDKIEQQWAKSL
jgi:hypothetical protein